MRYSCLVPFVAVALAACSPAYGEQDGSIPEGESISPFDANHPAITNLDP